MKKEEIEQAIIDAAELISKEGGMPESLWVPNFGWVLWQGKPTETSVEFYEYLKKNNK